MNAQQLKDYLTEDEERIEKALEAIGCHRIWRAGGEFRCAPPDGNNHTAISVNMETLFCRYYKEGETFRGDLIALAGLIRNEGFSDSFRFIKGIFGLGGKFVKDNRRDPLAMFKNIRKQSKPVKDIKEIEVPKFGLETLDEFVKLPHISLFYEGIMPQTSELFKVCYDPNLDRIIFPHFAYDDINAIVGMTGRTTRSKEEIKELMIPKYWNYIRGYMKTWNLYGFSHSIKYIEENGILIIFEAEKSVLKQFTQTRNKGFSCAVGGHELNDIQVQILMSHLPSDVEVCIAFDKDVMNMVDEKTLLPTGEKFLIDTCKKFSRYRKASYIWDSENLLGEKDSPIDKGYKVFHHLLENRRFV